MNPAAAIELVRHTLLTALVIAAPLLASVLLVSLIIAIMQTVVNIQEQTLTIIPKVVTALIVTTLLAPWMLQTLLDFANSSVTPIHSSVTPRFNNSRIIPRF